MKTSTGDFLPIIKYDARSGQMKRIDQGEETIIPHGTTFLFDFGTLEAGYVFFGPRGPDRLMVPYYEGVALPPQPGERDTENKLTHRPGFYVKVAGEALLGVREWVSAAASLLGSVDALYHTYKVAPEAARGQVPIVIISGMTPIRTGSGIRANTAYAPIFQIQRWIDRPEFLGPRTTPLPGGPASVAAPVQPAPTPPPPPVQPAAAARPTMPF
jgi:hypothetical protein